MNPLLAKHLKARDEFQATVDGITAKVAEENRDLSEVETANFNAAVENIEKLDGQISGLADLEERLKDVAEINAKFNGNSDLDVSRPVSGKDEAIYHKGGRFSFFHDLAYRHVDASANERVRIHEAQTKFSGIGTTDVGEIVPPLYLTDDLLRKASIQRVVTNLVTGRPWLPGMTHHYPRVSTTVAIANQGGENTTLTNTNPDTDDVTTSVVTLGGYTEESEQLLSQASIAIDQEIFTELREQYDAQVENYVLNDSTEGLLSVAGTSAVTYTDASPTVGEFGGAVGSAITAIAAARYRNATTIVMSARRAAWLKTQTDTTGRFIYNPVNPWNAPGGSFPQVANGLIGYFLDLPVYVSNYVPLTHAGATPAGQDPVIVANFAETRFRESGSQVALDRSVGFKSGTVCFRLLGMLSFTAKRAPAEVAVITGSGLINPF